MRHTIPSRLNWALFTGVVIFNLLALFALPLLLARSPWYALLLVPFMWVSNMQWGLIHESIHKILNPSRRVNEFMGRALSVLLGASFYILRFGHLMHHKLNRHWHSELVAKKSLAARLDYYWSLLFGLYGAEVAMSYLISLLPKDTFLGLGDRTFLKGYPEVHTSGERFFYDRGEVWRTRADVALITLLYGAALVAYGKYWPALLLFVALRGFVISFLDNIYHYATPADNSKAGKELSLPGAASVLLLNSNYHETHHANPTVPWALLPERHAAQARAFDGAFLAHGLRQFEGPVLASQQ